MSRLGPAPEPTALKILKGNPGRRPLNDSEPKPETGIPSCPEFLDTEAKREWGRVAKELARIGVLTKVDRAVLAAYCQSWADFSWACKAIKADGRYFCVGSGDSQQQHPHAAVKIKRDASAEFLRLAAELGLTPSARTRLKVEKPKPKKKLQDFANQRRA